MREITADEAATATKRGAPLVKLCRRGAPHVVFAQARADALTWVGRRAVSYTHLTLPTILLV